METLFTTLPFTIGSVEYKNNKGKKTKGDIVMSAELQNISQCADQLLCLSLRTAVALAVIHPISKHPA